MASIGELTAKLVLESAEFIAGFKKSADAVARNTAQMSSSLKSFNSNLKLALGGGVLAGARLLFERLNAEAKKTSAIYKQFGDTVSASFDRGFGEGVNENFTATLENMRQLSDASASFGKLLGGTFATAVSNAAKWITTINSELEKFDKFTGGAFGEALRKMSGQTDDFTKSIEANAKSLAAWKAHVIAGINDMATAQEAYNLAIEQGLGDEAAWTATLDSTAKATANNAKLLQAVADDAQQFTDRMASGLADVVTGTKDLRSALADLAKDLAKMAATQAFKDLFGLAIGSATGTTPNLSATGTALTTDASLLHGGGVAGMGGARRAVPTRAFDFAPRFHNGFFPGEIPAVLKKTETVLTSNQMAALTRGGGGAQVNMPITIDARGADREGLLRVKQELSEIRRTFPAQVVRAVRNARDRRVPL